MQGTFEDVTYEQPSPSVVEAINCYDSYETALREENLDDQTLWIRQVAANLMQDTNVRVDKACRDDLLRKLEKPEGNFPGASPAYSAMLNGLIARDFEVDINASLGKALVTISKIIGTED